jgi:cell division protein FtsB
MNVDLGIWGKLTRVIIFLLLLAVLLGLAVWYLPLIRQNEAMRKEILRLDAQIKVEEEKVRLNESAIKALRHDPKTVERLAREKLGYARPGETVIRFEEPKTNLLHVQPPSTPPTP